MKTEKLLLFHTNITFYFSNCYCNCNRMTIILAFLISKSYVEYSSVSSPWPNDPYYCCDPTIGAQPAVNVDYTLLCT